METKDNLNKIKNLKVRPIVASILASTCILVGGTTLIDKAVDHINTPQACPIGPLLNDHVVNEFLKEITQANYYVYESECEGTYSKEELDIALLTRRDPQITTSETNNGYCVTDNIQIVSTEEYLEGWTKLGVYTPSIEDNIMLYETDGDIRLGTIQTAYQELGNGATLIGLLDEKNFANYKSTLLDDYHTVAMTNEYINVQAEDGKSNIENAPLISVYKNQFHYEALENKKTGNNVSK